MKIAVIGAGGVGGTFGAALAKAGADVWFLARGAHLDAMRTTGLRIVSPRGDSHLVPTQASDDPAAIGAADVVLFCVKLWDVESAGERILPIVGPGTAVIPLQNGIDASDRLIPILGAGAVMGGVAQVSATIEGPGVVRQTGTFMRLVFGELNGERSARGEAFLALCRKAGFDADLSEQIRTELWLKFIVLATNSAITAATRLPFGKLRGDADVMALFQAATKEVVAVGRAAGVPLPEDAAQRNMSFLAGAPAAMMASMAHDLIKGGRIELPWLSGKVVAMGRELGVPTPVHEVLYAVLKPYVEGAG
ncbi:MAG TPA: 2-dehydropantoate 2-reductase [Acetobacteraceae bacterium]|nr:2-dehydropantoate 2-reductase [Acetobacteraceae bacterium]